MDNKKELIGFAIVTLILINMVGMVIMNEMTERIKIDCSKINYNGTISYWDTDINCSFLKTITR